MATDLGADKRQRRLCVRSYLDDISNKPFGVSKKSESIGKNRTLVWRKRHETLVGELRNRCSASSRQGMSGRQRHHEGIPHHHLRRNVGRNDIPTPQGEIRVSLDESFHRRLGKILAGQFELDPRSLGPNHSREPGDQAVSRHAGEGYSDQADLSTVGSAHRCLGAAYCRENLLGRTDERFTARCELHRPSASFEKHCPELAFELLDRSTERRLCNMQLLRGAPEMQLLGYRQEGPQFVHIHTRTSTNTDLVSQHLTLGIGLIIIC